MLGFPSVTQAFYISCPSCADLHEDNQEAREFCQRHAAQIDEQYSSFVEEQQLLTVVEEESKKDQKQPSRAESLTDATTLIDSEVATPANEPADPVASSGKIERKAAPETFKITPTKRSKRLPTEVKGSS